MQDEEPVERSSESSMNCSYSSHGDVSDNNVEEKIKSNIANNSVTNEAVQVSSGDFVSNVCKFIKTEKDLVTMCNVKSFNILNELTALSDEFHPSKRKRLINTRDSIILTLAKFKLDIPFNALGVLFDSVSDVTVRNIFYDTMKKLSTILQCALLRISKEEIQRNMPKCFDKFQTMTSVLDCTEIKVQKPKCLKLRIKLYSPYKGDLTIKFLTEVTAGMLVHVSKSFGG